MIEGETTDAELNVEEMVVVVVAAAAAAAAVAESDDGDTTMGNESSPFLCLEGKNA